jgi:IS30 family transposase
MLLAKWSPEQISESLALRFPNDDTLQVSHETIYRSLFVQTRGVFRKEFTRYLRTSRSVRRAQKGTQRRGQGGQILDALSIRERPAEADDRAVPGHWEGDLLCGSPGSQIITLVERSSRFVILIKIENRETHTVVAALAKHIQRLPMILRRSLTWDRGTELAAHKDFTVATDVKVYFCDPHSPWQRGSNENTNGLLRQYLPKGTDLSVHSQRQLDKMADELNDRPRKTLGFTSPVDTLRRTLGVALTH